MNTPLVTTLQELAKAGEKLLPQGGSEFSGYNAKRQSKYLLWRKKCLDAIGVLRENGTVLFARVTNDENGMYFYQSSAQTVMNAIAEALQIAQYAPEPVIQPVPAPVAAVEAQEPVVDNTPDPFEAVSTAKVISVETAAETISDAVVADPEPKESVAEAAAPAPEPVQTQGIEPVEQPVVEEAHAATEEAIVPPVVEEAHAAAEEAVEPLVAEAPAVATAPSNGEETVNVAAESDVELALDDERSATITPVLIFASATHPVLGQLQKFFNDVSIECMLLTHAEGAWPSLTTLHDRRPLPRYAVFLLSEEYREEELLALGYLAGKYPWLTLCCIHHQTIILPSLLPGISSKEYMYALDEIKFGVMKELKTAGYSVSL